MSSVPAASGCCSRSLPCDEPVPWALHRPTASCCLSQRRARATEAVLKKRAVLQAGVNTATTSVEAKRARQVLAARDGALSGCCSSCLSRVANWGHLLRHQRESQAGARAHTNHGGASVLTGKLKELWKPPEASTMEMVGGKDQNLPLRRRAGESKGLSTKLG